MGTSKGRIAGLDLAKTIAIFLVILIHYSFYSGFMHNTTLSNAATTFTTVGVPLFFMVNGYLLMNGRFSMPKHVHKIGRMVAVLLIWKLITLPIMSVLNHAAISWKDVPAYLLGGSYEAAPLGYFWFINALLSIYIIFPLIKIAYDHEQGRRYLAGITAILAALIFGVTLGNNLCDIISTSSGHHLGDIFSSLNGYNLLGSYGYAFVYFVIGGYSNHIACTLRRWCNERTALMNTALIVGGVLDFALLFGLQRYQARTKNVAFYVENGYQSTTVLILTVVLFQLFLQVRHLPVWLDTIISTTGANTLGVYYLHLMLIYTLSNAAKRFALFSSVSLPANLGLVLLIFAVGTVISLIGKRIPAVKFLF